MVTAQEIRVVLASFVANGMDLESFEDWIVQNTWNIRKSGALEAMHLAYAIELRLSEHSSGHLPEEALRGELRSILGAQEAQFSIASVTTETGASNSAAPNPVMVPYQWQVVDRLSEVVSW